MGNTAVYVRKPEAYNSRLDKVPEKKVKRSFNNDANVIEHLK